MKRNYLLAALLCCIGVSQAFAHALWIETNGTGKKAVSQEVRIYFGEFGDKDITPTAKWFSDTRDFSLILLTPDKKEIRLSATAKPEYYVAYFTPATEGVYTLVMHHRVKEVYHGMLLDYNSIAVTSVGPTASGDAGATIKTGVRPDIKPLYKKNERIALQAFLENNPAGNKELEIVAPNGWIKKLYTDSTGATDFIPIWSGKYNMELTNTEKKAGEHHGAKYESIYTCATHIIQVEGKTEVER